MTKNQKLPQTIIRAAAAYLGLKGIVFTALLVLEVVALPVWMAAGMTVTWVALCIGLLLLSHQLHKATAKSLPTPQPESTPEARTATQQGSYVATANLSQN